MAATTKAELAAQVRRLRKSLERAKARNAALGKSLAEALEHQKASADILRVISSTPTDLSPVMAALAESAARLCEATDAHIWQREGDDLQLVASHGPLPIKRPRLRIGRDSVAGRAAFDCKLVHVHDLAAVFDAEFPDSRAMMEGGYRSVLAVPLVREGNSIGAILIRRTEVRPFTPEQLALLQTFADQAVIAIENVRLFNETKEALERQTATAEILKVISGSPTDVQPVFDAIVRSAMELIGGFSAAVTRIDGDTLHLAAFSTTSESGDTALKGWFPMPSSRGLFGETIRAKTPTCCNDTETEPGADLSGLREVARARGFRSVVTVPSIREGQVIGTISVTRREPGSFSSHHIDLLNTFADQAVIAIENVRLFNETKEALERQTATAEILKVISSSPTHVQPVFGAIAESAIRLLRGWSVHVCTFDGERMHFGAARGALPDTEQYVRQRYPAPPNPDWIMGRCIIGRTAVNISDCQADSSPTQREFARQRGYRAILAVPMLRDGQPIGAIGVSRETVGAFADAEVDMLRTFADQAVIAIENVRLFNETKETLERQTATAEILKVISSSPTDVQPVFDAIVRNAVVLCDSAFGGVFRYDGELLHFASGYNLAPGVLDEARARFPMRPDHSLVSGRAILSRSIACVEDAFSDRDHDNRFAVAGGWRRLLGVPMLREGDPIGVIFVAWAEPGPIPKVQQELVRTFADQAVIAIENVRLFKELEARTEALSRSVEQLTALGEVGQAISSTLDLETVLRTIVTRALQLTGLDAGEIFEYDEQTEQFRLRAAENLGDEIVEALRKTPMRKGEGAVGRSGVTGEPTEIPEILDASYQSRVRELLVGSGYRALLAVPLLREDHLLGALVVNRKTPGPFAPEIVDLLKTFATQSALAIQNARLFREIAEKSRQLEVASRHKSDFLASMSHELRTPLNAILGFNEMILGEVYGEVPADMKEPLADIQTSGKHLLRLINNVLDLAKIEAGRMELSLADYSVHDTVESVRSALRPLAADKGLEFVTAVPEDIPLAHGDPGRITQCLMNLAGNALKFTRQGRVEISVELKDGSLVYRVADTGIGIPKDKIETVFSEFRQSDATIASEFGGTGLGLSITKKFVEMHRGRIWVESEPGKGSTFLFSIPLRAGGGATP